MSMLRAFEKMLNPRRAEAEARELREDNEGVDEAATAPPSMRCSACRYVGPEQYCPRCLADTMRKIRRPRPRR